MNRILKVLLMTVVLLNTVSAQNKHSGTIRYSGTRLTYPLVEAWAKEYNKTHPEVKISVIPRGENTEADLKILAYTLKKESVKPEESLTIVANYAQLPITNSKNPSLPEWQKKGLTEEEFRKLYFRTEEAESKPAHNTVTIYTREKPACATRAFASHYGTDVKQSKGVGVDGDDKTLLQAVLKDTTGVSYNNLGFIYDLKTRKVIDGISVIPVDKNKNGKVDTNENIYADLDQLLHHLEHDNASEITIDKVNFVYNTEGNPAVKSFVQWVLTEGQKVNHQLGFLTITESNKAYSLKNN